MPAVRWTLVTAALCVSAPPIAPAAPALAPRVFDVTPASARRPAEVSVAINPTNPDHVVAVMMQGGAPGEPRVSNWVYASMDGGVTWKGAPAHNAQRRV